MSDLVFRISISLIFLWGILFSEVIFSKELEHHQFTKDLSIPIDSTATADDITNIYINPGGIGIHPLQFGYFYGYNTQMEHSDNVLFLNLFGIGFSGQWLNPSDKYIYRYTLGSNLIQSRIFNLGMSHSYFFSKEKEKNHYRSWDIGTILRPFRYFSLGVVGRALNNPKINGAQQPIYWDIGLAFRPWYKNPKIFTLAIDTTWVYKESYKTLVPRYFMEIVPFSGMSFSISYDHKKNINFTTKMSKSISQWSFNLRDNGNLGNAYSGGFLISPEQFLSDVGNDEKFLVIDLEQDYKEYEESSFFFPSKDITFLQLLQAIETAKEDSDIKGILIKGGNFSGGPAQAEELRESIRKFKREKPVFAYSETYSTLAYYIVSAASKIVMPESGSLDLVGQTMSLVFLKDFFDKVGLKWEYLTTGNYKSAGETRTRNSISKYNKEQLLEILSDAKEEIFQKIKQGRNLSKNQFDELLKKEIFFPKDAKEIGLINKVQYREEFEKSIKPSYFMQGSWQLSIQNYATTQFYNDSWGNIPEIAVVVFDGTIVSGHSGGGIGGIFSGSQIASEDYIKLLQKIRENNLIKGVILRINSGGGSALASDIIWKEIRKLAKKKKHVIVSIGDMAASGGYYLAVAADEIIANRNSITGSVGVLGGKLSMAGLAKMLGINPTVLKSSEKADLYSQFRTFTEKERTFLKKDLERVYQLFLKRVQRSRKLSKEELEASTGGRVYSGKSGRKRKMVDRNGGLQLAINLVRLRAELDSNYMVVKQYSPKKIGQVFDFSFIPSLTVSKILKRAIDRQIEKKNIPKKTPLRKDRVFFLMPYYVEIK